MMRQVTSVIYDDLGEMGLSVRLEYLPDGTVKEFPQQSNLLLVDAPGREPKSWYEEGYDPDEDDNQLPSWLLGRAYGELFIELESILNANVGYEFFSSVFGTDGKLSRLNLGEPFYFVLSQGMVTYAMYKKMLLASVQSYDFDKEAYLEDLFWDMLTSVNNQDGPLFTRLIYSLQAQFVCTAVLAQALESSNPLIGNRELTLVGKELRKDFAKVLGSYGSNEGFLNFVRDLNATILRLMAEYQISIDNIPLISQFCSKGEGLVEAYMDYSKQLSMNRAMEISV